MSEDHFHKALFDHVGVADPEDWRAVALALAEKYAPHALKQTSEKLDGAKVGRSETRGPERMMALSLFINVIREASEESKIRDDLKSTRAICRYIAGNSADAITVRKMMSFPNGISPRTIENMISKHQREHPEWMARTTYR
ncbi:hypothetical protein [Methylobacterium sp. J-076]|uniref:hypothetical protein n=1 Tax=Methylobacterium sp. J-076 TaxID=2836655 RepID=UPI001FBB310F|nr:hypothetical protein [Methylobacterium sp. J-076]MCJ2012166.1 hypothetical protein [Methylobacterium sp. J-076]